MARITVEDCLKQIDNPFALIHLAAKRVRQLRKGAEPLVICKNKDIVVALREIAAEKVIHTSGQERDALEAGNVDSSAGELPEPVETAPVNENPEDQEAAPEEK